MEWRKIASVTTGGMAFFFVSRSNVGKLSVVWNRQEGKWAADVNDITRSHFDTAKAAIRYLETLQ